MKVVWTEHSRNRLTDIQKESLIDAAERLAEHPFREALLPEDGAYRQLVVDEYRIIYRVTDRAAYVMTIVAPGMLYEQAL
jgi:hypothetical protein